MIIAGLQKMTLLDFPGRVACTVFLQGCNFRCPFCHNSMLLPMQGEEAMTPEQLLAFLEKRKGLLDGVCITGGEPTISPRLPELLRGIKALGYPVKLDTNGSRPDVLRALVEAGLVDYVAMDIKNSPRRYGETAGCPGLVLAKIEESVAFLLEGKVEYELRTTVAEGLHRQEDIREMGIWLAQICPGRKPEKLFLQAFTDRETVLQPGFQPLSEAQMLAFRDQLSPYIEAVSIRGLT